MFLTIIKTKDGKLFFVTESNINKIVIWDEKKNISTNYRSNM